MTVRISAANGIMFSTLRYTGYFYLLPLHLTLALTLLSVPELPDFLESSPPTSKRSLKPASLTLASPSDNLPKPTCNGSLLGFDLKRYSCLEAWSTIPVNLDIVTFGDRLDKRNFDVQLPRRFSGCECIVSVFVARLTRAADIRTRGGLTSTCPS